MNARNLIQASVIAALFAAGAAAQAAPMGEGDTQMAQPMQVHSTKSFAQAQAASLSSVSRSELAMTGEEGYAPVAQNVGNSHADRATVRAAAIQAERNGSIAQGDALSF